MIREYGPIGQQQERRLETTEEEVCENEGGIWCSAALMKGPGITNAANLTDLRVGNAAGMAKVLVAIALLAVTVKPSVRPCGHPNQPSSLKSDSDSRSGLVGHEARSGTLCICVRKTVRGSCLNEIDSVFIVPRQQLSTEKLFRQTT